MNENKTLGEIYCNNNYNGLMLHVIASLLQHQQVNTDIGLLQLCAGDRFQ